MRSEAARLGGFYAVNFAVLGAFVPFRTRYFEAQGFDAVTIGMAMAVMAITTIAAPYAWASLADRFQARKKVLLAGCFGGFAVVALAMAANTPWMLVCALAGYGLFWNAILPQIEALTLSRAAVGGMDYSRIRVWGSLGYIAATLLTGYAIEWFGVIALAAVLIPLAMLMCGVALRVPDAPPPVRDSGIPESIFHHVKKTPVLAFFLAVILVSMSHAPYYTFFDLFLQRNGYSPSQSGWLITIGVIAEVVLFWYAQRILEQRSIPFLLKFNLFASALRWCLLALFVTQPVILVGVQLLHAVSFALQHTTAMHFLHNQFPEAMRGRAQAFYSACAYGVGGASGQMISGWLWEHHGGNAVFLFSSAACLVGWLLVMLLFRKPDNG